MRVRANFAFLTVFALVGSAGCAPTTLYQWGDYENRLQDYYSDPATQPAFLYSVREIIEESEAEGIKPPPGLCLEYGIALYQSGYHDEALAYLQKEYQYWPESAVLVASLTKRINELGPSPPKADGDEMYWLPGRERPSDPATKTNQKNRRRR